MGIEGAFNSKPNYVDLVNLIRSLQRAEAILTAIAGVGNSVTGWIVSGGIIVSWCLKDLQKLIVNCMNTKK